jgi:hypothetical protein
MEVLADKSQRVLEALENPNYQWRTLGGLAEETGLPPDEITQILEGALADQVVTTLDMHPPRWLYTTRRHYRNKQPLWNRILTVLSDRIR